MYAFPVFSYVFSSDIFFARNAICINNTRTCYVKYFPFYSIRVREEYMCTTWGLTSSSEIFKWDLLAAILWIFNSFRRTAQVRKIIFIWPLCVCWFLFSKLRFDMRNFMENIGPIHKFFRVNNKWEFKAEKVKFDYHRSSRERSDKGRNRFDNAFQTSTWVFYIVNVDKFIIYRYMFENPAFYGCRESRDPGSETSRFPRRCLLPRKLYFSVPRSWFSRVCVYKLSRLNVGVAKLAFDL